MTSKYGVIKILVALIFVFGTFCLCLDSSWAEGKEGAAEDYQIRLGSRQFIPEPNTSSQQQAVATLNAKTARLGGQIGKVHMYMQFYEMPDLNESNLLKELGVEYQGYIPNNTWIVSAPADLALPESLLSKVRWIGEIQPEDKIAPKIRQGEIGNWAWNEDGSVNIVVIFFMDVPEHVSREILTRYGEIKSGPLMLNDWILKTSLEAIANLAVNESVKWIDEVPPPPREKLDGLRSNAKVNTVQNAPYSLNGSDIDIGQWDSGHGDTDSLKGPSQKIGHDDYYNSTGLGSIRITVEEGDTSKHGNSVAG
ncbi:MAG: hypothetical protein KAJ10_10820, partial [Thermodesulfovibrionia bacterium]|nr:hypothetical protein [Thermodesulfovibrionia bacterium]